MPKNVSSNPKAVALYFVGTDRNVIRKFTIIVLATSPLLRILLTWANASTNLQLSWSHDPRVTTDPQLQL